MLTIIHADCLDAMRAMEANSIDAIVTDPPYGIAFMGREWDHGVPGVPFWTEALRIAKSGAHLVAFGGTRTYHRLACAIEDAGWEMRDCLSWMYGSGFPKSLDVSKALDKAAGEERQVLGQSAYAARANKVSRAIEPGGGVRYSVDTRLVTAPATDAARAWQGWGTALKPAWEPIILARKPLVSTVAANVLAHGTGAINVDACRIGWRNEADAAAAAAATGYETARARKTIVQSAAIGKESRDGTEHYDPHAVSGRWPANVALDEEAAAMLDEQSGERKSQGRRVATPKMGFGMKAQPEVDTGYGDSGGASRFFYTAKASRKERGEGNTHPTVKPLALMRWLAKLVTPLGGVILDPFAGSGTTLLAAQAEGFDAIGIEREVEYVEVMRSRVAREEESAALAEINRLQHKKKP